LATAFGILTGVAASAEPGADAFVLPTDIGGGPVWGIEGGIRFSIWPATVGDTPGPGGPRGLLRVGYPIMPDGGYRLVNFIAIEPIVKGRRGRGFSELEPSAHDGRRGKMIDADAPPGVDWDRPDDGTPYLGHVEALDGDVARLTVCLRVEKFGNGAHVYLLASLRTDRPNELELRAFAEDDSAELDACILTATMGNFGRLRQVHLADRVATAQELYGEYTGDAFAPHSVFALADLPRTADAGVIVAATTDEDDPASTHPDPNRPGYWYYPGRKVTQYWRKYAGEYDDSLRALVNARRVYWASKHPIPNGISFENFELNERFVPGRATSFGLTFATPSDLPSEDP